MWVEISKLDGPSHTLLGTENTRNTSMDHTGLGANLCIIAEERHWPGASIIRLQLQRAILCALGHSDLTQLAFWQLLRDPAAPVASDGATKVAQSEHTRGSHIPY
jgi:hypothetical protein